MSRKIRVSDASPTTYTSAAEYCSCNLCLIMAHLNLWTACKCVTALSVRPYIAGEFFKSSELSRRSNATLATTKPPFQFELGMNNAQCIQAYKILLNDKIPCATLCTVTANFYHKVPFRWHIWSCFHNGFSVI